MRILHVSPFYEPPAGYGGMARASALLCQALAQRGHEVTVATALLGPETQPRRVEERVVVHRFPGPAVLRRFLVPSGRGFASFLESALQACDIAHLHGHRSGLAVTAVRGFRTAGVPFVLQPHGTFPPHGQYPLVKSAFDALYGRRIVTSARALIAVSQAEASDLPRAARVIGNGVATEPAVPRNAVRDATLVFVGSDRPQKRGDLLAPLLEMLPNTRLLFVGPFGGSFRRRFECFGDRVQWLGVLDRSELRTALASAHVLVQPAVAEAFGLTAFEAALQGTCAVVAGGHGSGEWFSRAGGCVVPPDDVAALADAVRRRLAEPAHADGEARTVAEFVGRELTWERVARDVESVYHEVLGLRTWGAA